MKLYKGKRYTFKVVSRYFEPATFVINSRKKRTNGRFLGRYSRGGWIAEVVYDTDREYPDEIIRLYITNRDNRNPGKGRSSEVFVRVNLQNEHCETARGVVPGQQKPVYKTPPGVDLTNPCPPGQKYGFGVCY